MGKYLPAAQQLMTLNSLEDYQSFLAGVLTPTRLRHSTGMMQVMGELADVYQLDRGVAMTMKKSLL